MQDTGSTNDAKRTVQGNQSVSQVVSTVALFVSLHVAKVADVTHFAVGTTMGLLMWVVVRSSSGAALS